MKVQYNKLSIDLSDSEFLHLKEVLNTGWVSIGEKVSLFVLRHLTIQEFLNKTQGQA